MTTTEEFNSVQVIESLLSDGRRGVELREAETLLAQLGVLGVLVEATEEIDWAQWWTWWRRGRIELPVQWRARLRHYRHIRRLISKRRAVTGAIPPLRAD